MIKPFLEEQFGVGDRVHEQVTHAEQRLCERFKEIEGICEYNQYRVLSAFRRHRVSETHFAGTTGYGYDDIGREGLDKVFAELFGAEDALVRHNIVSGTHAIALCLYGVLRPGERLLSVTGKPYDTLEEVIGIRGSGNGSLKDFGIGYGEVELLEDGMPDYNAIKAAITDDVRAVLVQRSKGYGWRKTLSSSDIGDLARFIKGIKKDCIIIVDNCYGEFTENSEPTALGADLAAGSLIKNPGGGMARGGGYVAGKKDLVKLCAYRLNSPGGGKKVGPSLGFNRELYMGLFLSPFVTTQAIKAAMLCAAVFEGLGFPVCPDSNEPRYDIIQAVKFGSPELVISFCQGIQKGAAIDSYVEPMPWAMPGYDCEVIMASGSFTQGSSIELSADAPIKPPYIAYMQGSITYQCGKLGIMVALQNMLDKGLIKL